jgi:hypothetical protein
MMKQDSPFSLSKSDLFIGKIENVLVIFGKLQSVSIGFEKCINHVGLCGEDLVMDLSDESFKMRSRSVEASPVVCNISHWLYIRNEVSIKTNQSLILCN